MSAIFNIGSLVLGLISWIIPVVVIYKCSKRDNRGKFIGISFTSCGLALLLQLFEIRHRVYLHDWSALLDTIDILSGVAVILVLVTIILNSIALKGHD